MTSRKRLVILGSTGSVGSQCLDIVRNQIDDFDVVALMANQRVDLLLDQVNEFNPSHLFLGLEGQKAKESFELTNQSITFCFSISDFTTLLKAKNIDLVVNALPSLIGYAYSHECLSQGVDLALANKESIVLMGDELIKLSKSNEAKIIPLDSEASAVHQCLLGEKVERISNIYLTASGGPLYKRSSAKTVSRSEVLNHPVWNMGPKISVDSATMMNKAFEVYELHKLFGIPMENIKVLIHPESHVHSMIRFLDGNIKALVSSPDMKLPIHYALNYPDRKQLDASEIDLPGKWTFDELRDDDFECFHLAVKYLKMGGSFPAALCIVNDTLVEYYLEDKITFESIYPLLVKIMSLVDNRNISDLKRLSKFVKDCKELCSGQLK